MGAAVLEKIIPSFKPGDRGADQDTVIGGLGLIICDGLITCL
jgi:hypothetical protein